MCFNKTYPIYPTGRGVKEKKGDVLVLFKTVSLRMNSVSGFMN